MADKSDFIFDGQYAMRVVDKGNIMAYFTTTFTPLGLELRDVRLLKGKNGAFVAAPFRSYESNGETKYADFWRPAYDKDNNARNADGVAFVEAMAAAAMAEYERRKGGSSGSAGSSSKPAAARKSGRGPLAPTVASGGDEESESSGLPF